MAAKENESIVSSDDGLPARRNGIWGKEKLSFLDEFVPAALQATGGGKKPKLQRWYVDLFAGPGRNVDPETSEEFEGSAVRVLPMAAQSNARVHFTHAVLVNKNPDDQAALQERIRRLRSTNRCPIQPRNLQFLTDDANHVVHRIIRSIDTDAYALVFADITKPSHWPWASVRALKGHGHKSVDLYLLFPLGMALSRMMSYNDDTVEQSTAVLDRFFGTNEWRTLVDRRKTDAQSAELRRGILDLYMTRLRGLGWAHVLVARDIYRVGEASLYQMIYASNHPAGGRIAEWSASRPRIKKQPDLFE